MIARLLAAVVALAVIFGVVQPSQRHAMSATSTASAVASELDVADATPDIELNVPVDPVTTRVPRRQLVAIDMPHLDQPALRSFAPRTFRPPRS